MIRTFTAALAVWLATSSAAAQEFNALTLHYDRPAQYFEEAMVIGNGTMGGIVYGGTAVDKVSLNDITLWTGEPDRLEPSIDPAKAQQILEQVRAALSRGDYAEADRLNQQLEGHYNKMYQPLGELSITYLDAQGGVDSTSVIQNYNRWLDISNATLHTRYHRGTHMYDCEYFATAPDSGIVLRIKTEDPNGLHLKLGLSCQLPSNITAHGTEIVTDGYVAYQSMAAYYDGPLDKQTYDPNRGIHFRTVLKSVAAGNVSVEGNELVVKGGKEVVLYISNVTSFNGYDHNPSTEGRPYRDLVNNRINNLMSKGYEQLISDHQTDYKRYFDRVSLRLGKVDGAVSADLNASTDRQLYQYIDETVFNPQLEALYFQFGRYLLISCSRTDGVPANLQGLWNEKLLPPWSCNYTTNINLEENYWAAETANLTEMHRPLMTYTKGLQASGERTAKNFYGVDKGWCLGHNTDIWAMTNPIGMGLDNPSWACWNMGGAWVSTHIWEHYTFTMDRSFLAEYYPVLKGAADFCMGWLVPAGQLDANAGEWADRLITAPSTSPENKFIDHTGKARATSYGGSADLSMVRECLVDARNAAIELKTDKEFVKQVDETLARLMPYRIGKRGNLQEWYYDWEDEDWQHRHQSHLFGLYPGHQYSAFKNGSVLMDGVNTVDALCNASAKTLEIKGDKTTGWSTGWRINLFARLGDADRAYHIYRKLLNYITPDLYQGPDRRRGGGTYPNLLDAHTPFQIDGNFGGCAGVVEMLMQSSYDNQNVTITLLPAIPSRWSDGKVTGLKARGNVTVDMEWADGHVVELVLTATKSMKVTLCQGSSYKVVKLKKGKNIIQL